MAAPAAISNINANGNPMIRVFRPPDSDCQCPGPVGPGARGAKGRGCGAGTFRRAGAGLRRRVWCLRWLECSAISQRILNGRSTSHTTPLIKANTKKNTQTPQHRQ